MVEEEEIDLRDYINILLKRKWLIIVIFLIAVITAAIISYFLLESVYEVSSTIIIKQPKDKSDLIYYYSLEEYKDLIKDNEIEEEIIKLLELNKPLHNLSVFDLEKNISIDILKETNKIKINYQFKEPEMAKKIINAWVNLFVEKQNKVYFDEVDSVYQKVKDQYEEVKKEFFEIEKEKIYFDISNDIIVLNSAIENNRTKINNYNTNIKEIAISLVKQKTKRELISIELAKQEKIIKLKREVDDSQYFQKIFSEIIVGNEDMLVLQYEVEEKNPIYYSLYQDLLNTNSLIKMMEAEKEQLMVEIDKLNVDIDELITKLVNLKIKDTYLQRDFIEAKEAYDDLSKKYKEIESVFNTKSDLLKIEKLASIPQAPIKPNKKLNIAIAGVLGLFIGIFIAFFAEFWQAGKR